MQGGIICFSTALGSQGIELLSYNQSRNPDVLSRSSQTIWNAQYPLWLRNHVGEHVDIKNVVTR